MRVLVFGGSPWQLKPVVKALADFASVEEIFWQCKPILTKRQAYTKVIFRTMESFYQSLVIFREIFGFHADIVLTQYVSHYGLIGVFAARLSRRPCVVQAIGSDLKIVPKSRLGMIIVSIALKMASGVICVSKDLQNIAQHLGAKRTIVIPSPLDLSNFSELNLDKKNREVISVANLRPVKGMSYLIRAMEYIKDANLIVIGDGPEKKNLEALSQNLGLSNRVFFVGYLSHGLVFWNYLQQATVFVLPSLSEGCPRSLLEAMACGLPIVATDVGGVPEIMKNEVNGILVPSQDERALARAIKRILSDTRFQKNASVENKKTAKKYVLSMVGKRIYDYLKEICLQRTRESQRNMKRQA